MLRFKLRFALRNLRRHRLYTALNLAGLALGLAVAILVSMYLHQEFSYDKHHPGYSHIYRANSHFTFNGSPSQYGGVGLGLGPKMADYFEGIEAHTFLIHSNQNILFSTPEASEAWRDVGLTDENYFEVFELDFLHRESDSLLSQPRTIVLSESMARSLWGTTQVLGKTVSTVNYTYTIQGVFKDLPANTHHFVNALIAFPKRNFTDDELRRGLWNVQCFTFFKLQQGATTARAIETQFKDFYQEHMAALGKVLDGHYRISLTCIDKLHFNAFSEFDAPGGQLGYLYGFGGIGLLILILAGINYINMATARGLKRIREAGMRKVLGASKGDIRGLLLVEAVLLSLVALFVAFVVVELVTYLAPLQEALGKTLSLSFRQFPFLIWLPLALALLVGFLSGWYPAYSLAGVSPLEAFTHKKGLHLKSSLGRKLLVGFQVTVSVGVVVIASHMYGQINFIKNKSLGFQSDNVLVVPVQDSVSMANLAPLKEELTRSNYVSACAESFTEIGKGAIKAVYDLRHPQKGYQKYPLEYLLTGLNYLETLQIDLLQGRDFTAADSALSVALVNQALVDSMGWENPLQEKIKIEYNEAGESERSSQIIGVVDNFNVYSLHHQIRPLAIFYSPVPFSPVLHIKLTRKNTYAAIADIEDRWNNIAPEASFQFSFLDQSIQEQYTEETRQSKLILYLTALAIFISFLGFIGLASFTVNLRTREIGIRKVLGASTYQTVNLIFRELLLVILGAVILAIPVSLAISVAWLSNFAYQAPLQPAILVLSAFFTLLIGYGIVALHALTISRTKTINSLHKT